MVHSLIIKSIFFLKKIKIDTLITTGCYMSLPWCLASKILNIKNLVITRGSDGAFLYDSNLKKFFYSPAFATRVVDKVGAGDTMLSIISLLIKLKSKHLLSLFIGSLAGAISVERLSNKVPLNKTKLFKYMEHIIK